jgi:3-oxoacyl-[acyl-carrier-protein] synthase II
LKEREMVRGNRCVVVSMGIESSLGHNIEEFWVNLLERGCGIRKIESIDPTGLECQVGGEVWGFQPTPTIQKTKFYPRRSDKSAWFADSALAQAMAQSRLPGELLEDTGLLIGSNMVGAKIIGEAFITEKERGPSRVDPQVAMRAMPNTVSGVLSILYHLEGGGFAPSSACATSAHAIGEGSLWIQTGFKPFVFVGGTEWATVKPLVASFGNLGALTKTHNDCPERASRPFDSKRDGFVPAEGAGILGLTTPEIAEKYGFEILAEIIGYGASYDADDMINPTGKGASLAMKRALRWAEIDQGEIDYVNAHATSTWDGDLAETEAIKMALGKRAYEIPVSSTKGQVGHALGATAAIESIATIQALRTGTVPMTLNCETPGEGCDLDYVTEGPRKVENLRTAMKNSFGFGGNNACLIYRRWEP